jgi:sterol desaturase/sphingolipid hydroxylase (fatty acid hydroxylase superfamily)
MTLPASIRAIWTSALFAALLFGATWLVTAPPRQTIAIVAGYALLGGVGPPLLLALIEQMTRPAGPRKSRRAWLMHLEITLAYAIAGIPFAFLAAYLATLAVKHLGLSLGLIDLRISGDTGPTTFVLSILGTFCLTAVVGDFFFYWFHRTLHMSPILWQHHKMHHLDPAFDALTGTRHNWMEQLLSVFFIFVPMAILFKMDRLDALNAGLFNGGIIVLLTIVSYANHTNMRIQFGWANLIFMSSQTHRIHHSPLAEHRNRNFAAICPIWDVIFGTFYRAEWDEFPLTGLADEKEIQSVWEAQIFPLREWWKMFRAWRRARPAAMALSD